MSGRRFCGGDHKVYRSFGCKPSGLVEIQMFQCKGSSMKIVAAVCGGQIGTGGTVTSNKTKQNTPPNLHRNVGVLVPNNMALCCIATDKLCTL